MKPSILIFGLGNPGKAYENTRHNLGFMAVDGLARAFGEGDWKDKQKFKSKIMEARIAETPVLLVKPQNFMNLTGEVAKKMADFYNLDPKDSILVICDDVDISLGEIRLRENGSAGTHNGLKSFVEVFGEDFPRLRIGLGAKPQGADLAAWVLSALSPQERLAVNKAIKKIPELAKRVAASRRA